MNAAGKPVTSGISALRKMCFHSTRGCDRPLARATSTYCLRISSMKVFLVSIVTIAKLPITRQVSGSVRCQK